MDINTLISAAQTRLSALLTESGALAVSLDSKGFGSVMGPAVKAAGSKPQEVQNFVKDDPGLTEVLELADSAVAVKVHTAVRVLLVKYGDSVATRAVQAIHFGSFPKHTRILEALL